MAASDRVAPFAPDESPTDQDRTIRIGALSERTGCKIETIRFYEKAGIIQPAGRSRAGHRIYTVEHEKRLSFVRKARSLGFSLDEVRQLLRMVDETGHTCDEVRSAAEAHLRQVRERVADLRTIERVLAGMVKSCRGGDIPDCPVVEALYASSRPRRRGHAH